MADSSDKMSIDYCSPKTNNNIRLLNQKLKDYTKKAGITFIDIYPHFLAGKELDPKFSVDGVHLTGDAYLLWTKLLKSYVEE